MTSGGVIIAAKTKITKISKPCFRFKPRAVITPNFVKRKESHGISKTNPKDANIVLQKLAKDWIEIMGLISSMVMLTKKRSVKGNATL